MKLSRVLAGALAIALSTAALPAEPAAKQRTFGTARAAADALVAAADRFDVAALEEILGPHAADLIETDDLVLSRNQAAEFTAQAKVKLSIVPDPKDPKRAALMVGADDWPLPIPLVEKGTQWHFDTAAGRKELLLRRIGNNELDAIEVCRGYVEAQEEYADEPRGGSTLPQYAQHIIGTPDKQDGLAWRDADGTWRGPIGEKIARAIAEGYTSTGEPYHGYYFKILKGQGPSAPLGTLDFVVHGAMIGGFALVASPAEYEVTGIESFIVSHDGVVFEKDLGPKTLETFRKMERFDPDKSWTPVLED